jgi:hypothetical protein
MRNAKNHRRSWGSIDACAYALTQLTLDISGYFAP